MAYTTINKSSDYFLAKTYTGTGNAGNTISVGWKSDFLWLKSRTQTYPHYAFDTTRGGNAQLNPNSNAAESTSGDNVTFNTTSFVANTQAINEGGQGSDNMISWNWKANGGTTSSNSSGSITSTVQANTTSGFSIVTYTGNNTSGATVGHGLGAAPDTIILKARGIADQNWFVNTPVGGGVGYMMLNQTNADSGANSSVWNSTSPTSTVFTLGNSGGVNDSTTYVAYCFKSIQGYSKMGNYKGNGNDDGPFIYTGFKPAFVMAKESSGTGTWFIWDNKRTPDNVIKIRLLANTTAGDDTSNDNRIDFLSNGFKIRDNSTSFNENNATMFYMAFAQNPLVATNGVPATAR
jgi:hypothetical protein